MLLRTRETKSLGDGEHPPVRTIGQCIGTRSQCIGTRGQYIGTSGRLGRGWLSTQLSKLQSRRIVLHQDADFLISLCCHRIG